MFALSMKDRRGRGQSSLIGGQNYVSRFHNQTCLSSTNIPTVRPCSRRTDLRNTAVPFHEDKGGKGEGHQRLLSLPKLPVNKLGVKKVHCAETQANEHCQALKLPQVTHTPTIKKYTEVPEKSIIAKRRRSKSMKQKILGSSDANVLPNRPAVPQKHGNGIERCEQNLKSLTLQNPMISPLKKPVCNSSISSRSLVRNHSEHLVTPLYRSVFPRKAPPGQVSLRPKIDTDVLGKMQSRYKQPQSETGESETSRKTIKNLYSQMNRSINPDTIPFGGPMVFESRSVNKLILKPEVPRDLQVVRRKSKFMQNQSLQDVFSIAESSNLQTSQQHEQGGESNFGRFGDGNMSRFSTVRKKGPRWFHHHHFHESHNHPQVESNK